MADIRIKSVDEVFVQFICDRSIAMELSDRYRFRPPNFQYHPKFRAKIWDGYIRLADIGRNTIYRGLVSSMEGFANDMDYSFEVDKDISEYHDTNGVSEEALKKYIDSLCLTNDKGEPIYPYDYQFKGCFEGINRKRLTLISPTASGKSIMIYILLRWHLDKENGKKVLVLVPNKGLVTQLKKEFGNYSLKSKDFSGPDMCHEIFHGKSLETDKPIVISTWQTMVKQSAKYLSQFSMVMIDECHICKAQSLKAILEKMKNCKWRFGCTGTTDGAEAHDYVIQGLIGPLERLKTTKELIEENKISNLSIDCILLKYPKDACKEVRGLKYDEEVKYITSCRARNTFIANLCKSLSGNTLVLFNLVEKHGDQLHEMVRDITGRPTYYVCGKVDDRDSVRENMESAETDSIVVASYGTYSTGINIRNLHNVIFASPSKSLIRVLQSIGRGLRKHHSKDILRLFDISDDFTLGGKYKRNYGVKHLLARVDIYNSEKFDYKMVPINLMGK